MNLYILNIYTVVWSGMIGRLVGLYFPCTSMTLNVICACGHMPHWIELDWIGLSDAREREGWGKEERKTRQTKKGV